MARRGGRQEVPRRVVVIGASLAGAFAAAAVAGGERSVTVLERDVLPAGPRPRDGVPQGAHPHAILRRGLITAETLLPGFEADLRAAGAVPLDTGDIAWRGAAGWMPYGRRTDVEVLSASRPLFEHLVVARVRALPGVRLREGVRAHGVRRGSGTAGDAPWWVDLDDGSAEPADLVIDASGRSSRLPVWLAAAGVRAARVTEVDAQMGYSTRQYALDPARLGVRALIDLATPDDPTGGLVVPVEGGRWLVGLTGAGSRRPPRDADGFAEFARTLSDPATAQIIAMGEPLSDVAVHRQTGNRRHHYGEHRDWPAGLLVVGDALCAFDPIYGQGVTVAAQEALLLRRTLDRGWRRGQERRVLRGFGRIVAVPWSIATGEDRRFPGSRGARPTPVEAAMSWWGLQLGRLAAHGDWLAAGTSSRVYQLIASPWLLFRPGLMWHVVRARVRGYGTPNPRPPIVSEARATTRR